ncbi:hypothetical protein LF41_3187 [Lysobacter dokdonensis DS-58]|uniref:Uncharacterized protein n=1 Tax=Lysobacter dokdonensis DS-58 TaxID=1300345 RepID=A0A0A2WLN5_9GAMM|nr:hypothetical protein LF41_3187 [Lysobacter dokdonensis DS-58]
MTIHEVVPPKDGLKNGPRPFCFRGLRSVQLLQSGPCRRSHSCRGPASLGPPPSACAQSGRRTLGGHSRVRQSENGFGFPAT